MRPMHFVIVFMMMLGSFALGGMEGREALVHQLTASAVKTVTLNNGARFKSVEVGDDWLLVANATEASSTSCDVYTIKPDGQREYTSHFDCSLGAR